MKKMIILLTALIGFNSITPLVAATAETMYKDLVEPIMLTSELPVDKAQKIYDLKKQIEIDKKKIDFHIGDDKSFNGFLVSLYALLVGITDFAILYENSFEDNYARNWLRVKFAFDSVIFVAVILSSVKDRWRLNEYTDKSKELSRFIEKLEVLLEQLPKEYQKTQSS